MRAFPTLRPREWVPPPGARARAPSWAPFSQGLCVLGYTEHLTLPRLMSSERFLYLCETF